jgi:type IV pilus assembly protein PilB
MPDDALRKEDFPEEMIKEGLHLYGPGEETEDNPGYKGRAGIYQVMPISDDMKRLIIEEANAVVLADQAAKEGVWDIRRSGLQKVAGGITSLAEVNRVTVE